MVAILLLGDERKGGNAALVERHAQWLRELGHGVEIVLDRDSPLADRRADLVVVFGGDGSLLGAARRMGEQQKPTLGINVGRLGFLTAFDSDRAREAIALALAGKLVEERRLLLRCHVEERDGTRSAEVLAMNDGVLSRASVGNMITLRVRRGGIDVATWRGDGLIVATAAGSTAYSLAAGGPVLMPDMDALVLTPLASHTLSGRPLVLPVAEGIEIELVDTGGRKYSHFQIDGQVMLQAGEGARAVLRPAAARFRHLAPGADHFFRVLRQKLGFADQPRRRG